MQLHSAKSDQAWYSLYDDCGKMDDTWPSIKSAWLKDFKANLDQEGAGKEFSISHYAVTLVVGLGLFFVCAIFLTGSKQNIDFLSCGTIATGAVVVEFRWGWLETVRSRSAENPKAAALQQIAHSLLLILL